MDIRRYCLLVVLFCSTISLANVQRDSISIDPRWNYWDVGTIAPNGDWTVVSQRFTNDKTKDKTFVVHTDTKKRLDVTGINQAFFSRNDVLIGIRKQETIEVDLITNRRTSLGVLSQRDWIEEEQILCAINENKELVLKKYAKKGNEVIWEAKEIAKYFINPSKTKLLYQKGDGKFLYLLDFKTLKEKQLVEFKEELQTVSWNIQENAYATKLKDNEILFTDLEMGVSKIIELPRSKAAIVGVQIRFFSNNDLYITYSLQNETKKPKDDYVDIWNGNSRELKYKNDVAKWRDKKPEGDLKAVVYFQKSNAFVKLDRDRKQEYVNIGVPNYLLVYDPLELEDYKATSLINLKIRYRLLELNPLKELGDLAVKNQFISRLNMSPNQQFMLYPNEDVWEVYDFQNHSRVSIPHNDVLQRPMWTKDSKNVIYSDGENIVSYSLKSRKHTPMTHLKVENRFEFLNTVQKDRTAYVDMDKPFLFTMRKKKHKTSYYSWFKNKNIKLIDDTNNTLNSSYYLKNGISEDGNTAIWREENYDQPHTIKVFRKGKVKILLEPEVPKELYAWKKQKVIQYKDKYGVDLIGILWYPKNFEPDKKYPMVTYIYQIQSGEQYNFGIPSLKNDTGFNRSLLTEQGYFVFQPDTYVSEEGPGLSALECVTKGVENITALEPAIDKAKLGLMGHSFGGYETGFILANSKLFVAGIAGGGVYDLISCLYEFNYAGNMPNYHRVETGQFSMKQPFSKNAPKYYANSPILFAQNYETPVLLWTGREDYNAHWEQTRHMYVALKRYEKPVIALFYKNEGHALSVNNAGAKDLSLRVLDWFDYYLKNIKTKWITDGVDYSIY